MRISIVSAIATAALLGASSCFAMGGGYGGGMGPSSSGGMHNTSGFTDYASALRLIGNQKYAEAIPYLEKALRARPDNTDVLNYLGFTQRMVGNYQVSLDYYQRALARNPDHKGAHEYLGELYLKLNQVDNARGQLAELTRLCPEGCEEKDALTKAIADYQMAAAAPAATAVPASAAGLSPPAVPAQQPTAPAQTPNP